MARLVPAKPKSKNKPEDEFLWELQSTIGDEHVIIQNAPKDHWHLVGAPGKRWALIAYIENVYDCISHTGELILHDKTRLNLPSLFEKSEKFLKAKGINSPIVRSVFIRSSPNAFKVPLTLGGKPGITILDSFFAISLLSKSGETTTEEINSVVQKFSPGSSTYIPGQITQPQEDLRNIREYDNKEIEDDEDDPFFGFGDFPDEESSERAPTCDSCNCYDFTSVIEAKNETISLLNSEISFLRDLIKDNYPDRQSK